MFAGAGISDILQRMSVEGLGYQQVAHRRRYLVATAASGSPVDGFVWAPLIDHFIDVVDQTDGLWGKQTVVLPVQC